MIDFGHRREHVVPLIEANLPERKAFDPLRSVPLPCLKFPAFQAAVMSSEPDPLAAMKEMGNFTPSLQRSLVNWLGPADAARPHCLVTFWYDSFSLMLLLDLSNRGNIVLALVVSTESQVPEDLLPEEIQNSWCDMCYSHLSAYFHLIDFDPRA